MWLGILNHILFKLWRMIMLYFNTRKLAREFSSKNDKYSVIDSGSQCRVGFRWGVKVL